MESSLLPAVYLPLPLLLLLLLLHPRCRRPFPGEPHQHQPVLHRQEGDGNADDVFEQQERGHLGGRHLLEAAPAGEGRTGERGLGG